MKQPNFAAMSPVVAKAIEQMMAEQGDKFSLEKVNLAELKRRTGISRARLRRMKEHGFEDTEHAAKGRKASTTLLSGYTGKPRSCSLITLATPESYPFSSWTLKPHNIR